MLYGGLEFRTTLTGEALPKTPSRSVAQRMQWLDTS
jgi:hypothetical protein